MALTKYDNVRDGLQNVATPGSAVQLAAASTRCEEVTVMANLGNTDVVTVGDSTVVGAASGRRGIPLAAGVSVTLALSNLNKVWLDAVVAGEGVSFLYFF